ncbi:MAG: FMN-binding negative transcriptional regulator [Gammaproteobacteria bacterium]|nr:FMN-binding negative transcriptional regulator [Gammaproteobacteria bacterium]
MKITDINQLHQFIEQFNFATLISHVNGKLNVSHIPVMLNRNENTHGMLAWHLAKQNPHARELDGSENALFIFHGPHAYVSPNWYKSSPSVPTWNYAVVHAYGNPKQASHEQLESDLSQMVMQHEGDSHYSIPDDYQRKLMDHIVGFRMEITKIEGIFKLGQNRSQEDQSGMLAGLQSHSAALAEFIQSTHKKHPNENK